MSQGADSIEVTREPERLGPYMLLERIGAGGMAEGYRAVKFVGAVRQMVFLKRILSDHRADPDYVRWFQREAAIVASLRHVNIVSLQEVDPAGRYLAFELINGLDLRHLLRAHPERRLPTDFCALILTGVLKALDHAHTRTSSGAPAGVIHRDLDPSNVLISYVGEVKVADFGVATVIRGDGEPLTSVVGKPHYQAPEETRNEGGQDGRSDLFSLGVVAYQILSGERPYTGTRAEIARASAAGRRVPLRSLVPEAPTALVEIVDRLLSPDPADRFASALECEHAIYAAHAPDPKVERELGHLALRARPHETIETSRLRSLAARAALVPSAETPSDPSSDTPAADSGNVEVHSAVPDDPPTPTARAAALVEEGATGARRTRRRTRLVTALVAGLVAAGLGLTAVITGNQNARPSGAKAPLVSPAPTTAPPPPTAPTGSEPTAAAAAAAAVPFTPTEPPPSDPAPPAASGALRIGAVPQSQVWIDGRMVGWCPRTWRVQAGQHTVSIGRDDREEPSTRREVTVTPGHTTRVGF